jgi:chromosome segregation ATPase
MAAESGTESRLREALRSTAAQLRALEDERSTWQAKEAELQRQIETLKKEQSAAKPVVARTNDRALAEAHQKIDDQSNELEKGKAALAQCQTASQTATSAERDKEEESAHLREAVQAQTHRAEACEARNEQIAKLAQEGLDRVSRIGGDPLFGFGDVKRENLAQDYQDRILEQKVKP